jgi:ribosomal protein S18 acetylase RimI-like enzyme
MLCVHPEKQGRGLGKMIIKAVEDFASESKGCDRIQMWVVHVRDSLIAFYERLGFMKTGKTIPFPEDSEIYGTPLVPLHLIEMIKTLD